MANAVANAVGIGPVLGPGIRQIRGSDKASVVDLPDASLYHARCHSRFQWHRRCFNPCIYL